MTVSSVKTGDLGISFALNNNYMEPIATTLVDSGGVNQITFNDIPQTYKHLQLRGIARSTRSGTSGDTLALQFNGDTNINNYVWQCYMYSNNNNTGSAAYGTGVNASIYFGETTAATSPANMFGAVVADILEYTNLNHYKTTKFLLGKEQDSAAAGFFAISNGGWKSYDPVTSIKIFNNNGNFTQYSRFSLYGIKG